MQTKIANANNDSKEELRIEKGLLYHHLLSNFKDLVAIQSWGEDALFYNPGGKKPRGIYFCTFKEKDGPNDKASELNRGGIYRFNVGISKQDYTLMFGSVPKRPSKGGVIETGHDFRQINVITPHPVYGWMHWISVLNPSKKTIETLSPIIERSYQLAVKKIR